MDLQWHIVSGFREIEDLAASGKITEWCPKDDRHSLFLAMKYPNDRFYKGSWGRELLHLTEHDRHLGAVGKVYTTYRRYKEISDWLLKNLIDIASAK